MAALHTLDAATLATLYRRGELSPVEATRAVIERVEQLEPTLHATWGFDPDGALAAAAESEQRHRRGRPLSALDGVPAMLKENVGTRGLPKPLGCAAVEAAPEAEDSPPAARLREAGCVFVARTTMPDYGMLSSGLSSLHAAARNPWNPALTPGGSSAGAGAGAAAGYGPLHVGTDIGGSIRLPAGWCGVVGFKPSLGRVPIVPPYAGRCAGPITRTVADAALLMAELSRPDARDATSLPPQAIAWDRLDDLDLRGLRLGLLLDAGWGLAPQPCHVEVVTAAARAFEAAGCIVEPLAPFTTPEMAEGIDLFWRMRSWLDLQALPPERRERVLPFIRDWAGRGAGYSAAQVFHGHAQMAALRDAAVAACARFDFVLSPVAPVPAFPALHASPTNDPARAMAHIGFTLPFNMSEQPAVAVPAGLTADGLPVGLQIAGRRHDDLGVLQLARAWERLRPPLPAGPPI